MPATSTPPRNGTDDVEVNEDLETPAPPKPTFTIHRDGVPPADGSAHVQHRGSWPPPPEMIEELEKRGYDVTVAS